jgi:hippurate hydrolase
VSIGSWLQKWRIATGVAEAFGATAKVEFPDIFSPLVNNPAETEFIADAATDLVGEEHVDRNRSLITAAEDFAYMLEACPGAFINIGNAGTIGSCVHNPNYDFNDAALPIGASLFARLVEKKLSRLSTT